MQRSRRVQALADPRQLDADLLRPGQVPADDPPQVDRTEHVEPRGHVPQLLGKLQRSLQVLGHLVRRVAGGQEQGDGEQLAQPELVAGAAGRVRQPAEDGEGRFETGDDVPVGPMGIRLRRGLLEIEQGAPQVPAALEVPGQVARVLRGPAGIAVLRSRRPIRSWSVARRLDERRSYSARWWRAWRNA